MCVEGCFPQVLSHLHPAARLAGNTRLGEDWEKVGLEGNGGRAQRAC